MQLNNKFKVGDDLFVLTNYRTANKQEAAISKAKITAVGRKYITIGNAHRFGLSDEKMIYLAEYNGADYGFDHNVKAFASEKEANDFVKSTDLISSIYSETQFLRRRYETGVISFESLCEIEALLCGTKTENAMQEDNNG